MRKRLSARIFLSLKVSKYQTRTAQYLKAKGRRGNNFSNIKSKRVKAECEKKSLGHTYSPEGPGLAEARLHGAPAIHDAQGLLSIISISRGMVGEAREVTGISQKNTKVRWCTCKPWRPWMQ